jgi:hypothetical protein
LSATSLQSKEELRNELWTSLASLLRSYTAMHGLSSVHQAVVDLSSEKIIVRVGEKWLLFARNHEIVTWTRENRSSGTLELTDSGTLRGPASDDAMDLVAEQWARELMR